MNAFATLLSNRIHRSTGLAPLLRSTGNRDPSFPQKLPARLRCRGMTHECARATLSKKEGGRSSLLHHLTTQGMNGSLYHYSRLVTFY